MLTGRFGATSGQPCIEGQITIPRLGSKGKVSFLLDTGADRSILMPLDAGKINVNYTKLKDEESLMETSVGIGGSSQNYIEKALVAFANDKMIYVYSIVLGIFTPSKKTRGFPSLLGRDIIDQWRVIYDKSKLQLLAEVVTCDERFKIDAD